jgi:hypothetical protein
MNNKNTLSNADAEYVSLLGKLTHDQFMGLSARVQLRYLAAQLVAQTAYMKDPRWFSAGAPETETAPVAEVESQASSAYIATSPEAALQQGQTGADERLTAVTDLGEYRARREARMQNDVPAFDVHSQPHNPEMLSNARDAVSAAYQPTTAAERAEDEFFERHYNAQEAA